MTDEERAIVDHEFKKIYGRYPSTAERIEYLKNRPRRFHMTGEVLETVRKNVPPIDSVWNAARKRKRSSARAD